MTGLLDAEGNLISDLELPTLNATTPLQIVTVTAWPTRLFLAEAVTVENNALSDSNSR